MTTMNDITALIATMKAAAEKATPGAYVVGHNDINRHGVLSSVFVCQEYKGIAGGVVAECHVNCLTKNDEQVYANAEFIAATHPANVLALVEALEKALADSSELKPANLINKFYERYPVSSFKSESVRAEALGYFMAGAELQCFGEFVKYEELCSDE